MTKPLSRRRDLATLALVLLLGLPTAVLVISGSHTHPLAAALIYGVGILSGAFLLSWAAQVAELDISAALAIAILALLTILPEYAIEVVLAWDAGASFDTATRAITAETQRVAANVTGANRLLIGVGWSVVILIYWFKHRDVLDLRGHIGPELTFLTVATLLTFVLFFIREVHLLVAASLIVIYVAYLWVASRRPAEEPDLSGITATLGSLPALWRRTTIVLLLGYAAGIIVIAAEPFVYSLVETGQGWGVDDFILIQWVAPLASETPEVIVAVLFGLRANPAAGLTVLISSEVNKFTLLVGSMVGVFSISAGQLTGFPLDYRQAVEFLLTASVSLFALVLIARQRVDWRAGAILLGLFIAHLFFPAAQQRLWMACGYLGLALVLCVLDWRRVVWLIRGHTTQSG